MPVVTFTTDFGMNDGYVAAMKGVILGIAPGAQLVDITHAVPPQDVRHGAYVLYSACPYFPHDTVHLAVVDPGVGTRRRALAVRTPIGYFVGPDNGLFSYVLQAWEPTATYELTACARPSDAVSTTFHGRDVFAPAAARLASGVPVSALGRPVRDPVVFSPRLWTRAEMAEGEVIHIDHFGNVITSIASLSWADERIILAPAPWASQSPSPGASETAVAATQSRLKADQTIVTAKGRRLLGVHRTYSEASPGELVAVIGSSGHLEIAARDGSASAQTGLRRGDPVELWFGCEVGAGAGAGDRPAD